MSRHRAAVSVALRSLVEGPETSLRQLASFPQATYLEVIPPPSDGAAVVSIVAPDGLAHPNSAMLARARTDRPFASRHPPLRGRVGGGRIELGDELVTVSRWWNPRPVLPRTSPTILEDRTRLAGRMLEQGSGAGPARLVEGAAAVAAALTAGDDHRAVVAGRRLVGWGPGLTPSGDDVLCGLFVAAVLLRRALSAGAPERALQGDGGADDALQRASTAIVAAARGRTTTLSYALLWHAMRGEVAGPSARMLRALVGADGLEPSLERLLAVGSTSGRDLALGLLAGARLASSLQRASAAAASEAAGSVPFAPSGPSAAPRPALPPTAVDRTPALTGRRPS